MNSGMGSGSGHQALANANLSPQVIQVVSHCRSLISGDFQLVLLCPEVISWLPMPFNCTSSVLFVGDHSLIQYSLQTILAQGGIHLFLVLGGQFLVSTVYPLAYLVQ